MQEFQLIGKRVRAIHVFLLLWINVCAIGLWAVVFTRAIGPRAAGGPPILAQLFVAVALTVAVAVPDFLVACAIPARLSIGRDGLVCACLLMTRTVGWQDFGSIAATPWLSYINPSRGDVRCVNPLVIRVRNRPFLQSFLLVYATAATLAAVQDAVRTYQAAP